MSPKKVAKKPAGKPSKKKEEEDWEELEWEELEAEEEKKKPEVKPEIKPEAEAATFLARVRRRSKVFEITIPKKVVESLSLNHGDIIRVTVKIEARA